MNKLSIMVKEERKNLALTQEQFAKKLNLSNVSICHIENGKEMGSKVIKKLSKYFKLKTKYIRELMLTKEEIK